MIQYPKIYNDRICEDIPQKYNSDERLNRLPEDSIATGDTQSIATLYREEAMDYKKYPTDILGTAKQ